MMKIFFDFLEYFTILAKETYYDDFEYLLNEKLRNLGLKTIENDKTVTLYTQIPFGYLKNPIDKQRFVEILEKYNLFQQKPIKELRIRTFIHPRYSINDTFNDTTDPATILDLSSYFDNGRLKRDITWQQILDKIKVFKEQNITFDRQQTNTFRIEINTSLAFYLGSLLGSKEEFIEFDQMTMNEAKWNQENIDNLPEFQHNTIEQSGDSEDLIVGISVTHDVLDDIEIFLEKNNHPASSILHLKLNSTGTSSVKSKYHAEELASQASALISKTLRKRSLRKAHLFISAPNTFTVKLGQKADNIGACSLYEFDFRSKEARDKVYYYSFDV